MSDFHETFIIVAAIFGLPFTFLIYYNETINDDGQKTVAPPQKTRFVSENILMTPTNNLEQPNGLWKQDKFGAYGP